MIFPFRLLALGLGLAAAGGLAVWSSFHKNPAPSAKNGGPSGRPAPQPHQLAHSPAKPPPLWQSREQAESSAPASAKCAVEAAPSTPGAAMQPAMPVAFEATREELELRALIVERQANKQLKTLLGVLDLTEAQQDRLFSTLARHSDYYHPALQFQNAAGQELVGAPVTTPVSSPTPPATSNPVSNPAPPDPAPADPTIDPILAELDPDQVEVYERYRSERDSFWAGVVSDIEKELSTNGD